MVTGIVITIFSLLILLFSVIIHELSHGYVAYALGDPTAKYAGRLTINPISHLDPFGSVLLPLLLLILTGGQGPVIGWAKPVPINEHNLRDRRWGALKVALAGPLSNVALALVFGLLIRFAPIAIISQYPGLFVIFSLAVAINLLLAMFNLLPIPPLDGHWILFALLPDRFEGMKQSLRRYGFFIIIFLVAINGLFFLNGLEEALAHWIVGPHWPVVLNLLT